MLTGALLRVEVERTQQQQQQQNIKKEDGFCHLISF